jgi:hypothetical protein
MDHQLRDRSNKGRSNNNNDAASRNKSTTASSYSSSSSAKGSRNNRGAISGSNNVIIRSSATQISFLPASLMEQWLLVRTPEEVHSTFTVKDMCMSMLVRMIVNVRDCVYVFHSCVIRWMKFSKYTYPFTIAAITRPQAAHQAVAAAAVKVMPTVSSLKRETFHGC